jgi:hypothetical protein
MPQGNRFKLPALPEHQCSGKIRLVNEATSRHWADNRPIHRAHSCQMLEHLARKKHISVSILSCCILKRLSCKMPPLFTQDGQTSRRIVKRTPPAKTVGYEDQAR